MATASADGARLVSGLMKAFAHDVYTYPLPPGHRFPLGKYPLVREGAAASAGIEVEDARAASGDELGLAHEPAYLERVGRGGLSRREELALGLPWSTALVERARRAIGATIQAARGRTGGRGRGEPRRGTHHAFAGRGARLLRLQRRGRHDQGAPASPAGSSACSSSTSTSTRVTARTRPSWTTRDVHVLDQRLPQLPVPARAGRPGARPGRPDRRRRLPRGRRAASPPGGGPLETGASASTSAAPTRTNATALAGWR